MAPPAKKQKTFTTPQKTFQKTVTTSEHPNDLTYRKDMFYTKSANTTVILQDGKTLSFNKEILCHAAPSPALDNMFFGALKDDKATKISDVDYDTFKLFLDCLMGYEPYTFENAMEIFPVVWKYQIEQAIEECIKALKPSEMDERVCHLLNMASLSTCKKLVKQTLAFISTYNSYRFMEDYRYCHLLEPDSIKAAMSELPMDSYLLEKIVMWGENFIKNKQFGNSVQEFFEKADLIKYFKLEYFETTGALYNFRETEIGKNIFPSDKVLNYLQKSENLTHRNSKWKKVGKGTSVTEEIDLPVMSENSKINALIAIKGNKVVFYVAPESETLINCQVNVFGINNSGNTVLARNHFEITDSKSDIYSTLWISYDRGYNYSYNNPTKLDKLRVKLTWTFLRGCRVLLTNMPGDELNRDMYFAKNVTICI